MDLELEQIHLPAQAEVRIEVSVTARLTVTATTAQRKVSRLVLERIGNLLYGEAPNLVAGQRLRWRVPVWLGSPTRGPLGQIGALDVDAQSGELLFTEAQLDELAARAHDLAQHSSSPST